MNVVSFVFVTQLNQPIIIMLNQTPTLFLFIGTVCSSLVAFLLQLLISHRLLLLETASVTVILYDHVVLRTQFYLSPNSALMCHI